MPSPCAWHNKIHQILIKAKSVLLTACIIFVKFRHMREGRKNIHMRGIWAGKGFEKVDVQKEIKSLRKDISKSILKKGK